jgi:hypothetical protein
VQTDIHLHTEEQVEIAVEGYDLETKPWYTIRLGPLEHNTKIYLTHDQLSELTQRSLIASMNIPADYAP